MKGREITSLTTLHDKERGIIQLIVNRVPKRGVGSSLNLGWMSRDKWIEWVKAEKQYCEGTGTLMEQLGLADKEGSTGHATE